MAIDTLPRHRILFLAQEFVAGGAAFLALRHMQRLVPDYDIDLLVTGPYANGMLRQLPQQVSIFHWMHSRGEPTSMRCGALIWYWLHVHCHRFSVSIMHCWQHLFSQVGAPV